MSKEGVWVMIFYDFLVMFGFEGLEFFFMCIFFVSYIDFLS